MDYISDSNSITESEREAMISLIVDLSRIKAYKPETTHLAISIADRYFSAAQNLDECPLLGVLSVTALLIAAKMEEPMCPRFKMMLKHLPKAF